MQGMKQPATLKDVTQNDADVVELVVHQGIKKLIVIKCPNNIITNFNLLQFEEVELKCFCSDQFTNNLYLLPKLVKISDPMKLNKNLNVN